jgi:hypothetical protein
LVRENVPEAIRKQLLGHFISEDLADSLDTHYVLDAKGDHGGALAAEKAVDDALVALATRRQRAQKVGGLALIPFIAMLVLHGINHEIPLCLASFAGFIVALLGIVNIPRMRALALREARHEYAEYYFLFPLFFSITLLTKAGFFDVMQTLIHHGIESLGHSHVAFAQFLGCTLLSSILDNNVVADFASRALHNLDLAVMHLFAMSQIAGYALGDSVDQRDDARHHRDSGVAHGDRLRRKRHLEVAALKCELASYPCHVGCGFSGADPSIGNGPNFMVKSIAKSNGVKCPSFFGYVVKYTLPILIPLFALVSWLFLR